MNQQKTWELLTDLAVVQVYDWIKANKISEINIKKLTDLAIAYGLYYFVAEDWIAIQFNSEMQKNLAIKILFESLGKASMVVLLKMIMGREFKFQKILTDTVITDSISQLFEMVMGYNSVSPVVSV